MSVGAAASAGQEALLERAANAIRQMVESDRSTGANRVKPLIAVPVLGIGLGGLGHQRGQVISQQLELMEDLARSLDVDIAIVTPDSAVYAAAQYLRRQSRWPMSERTLSHARRLGRLARSGDLALFIGAGASIPAGLPTWNDLLMEIARRADISLPTSGSTLGPLDEAQLVANKVPNFGELVARVIQRHTRPSLAHVLLGSLRCREAVTTNYDRLYERAVAVQRGQGYLATVLPWEAPRADSPWVLKMHGDVKTPASIVLTRDQFVGYDKSTRPAGALLQSLLMTRHTLFVGASLNDDNVVRLAYEVEAFRQELGLRKRVGTLLDVSNDKLRRDLWRSKLHWVSMPGRSIQERSRTLEVFLDAVAAHASARTEWLLDPRFAGMLSPEEAEMAEDAAALYAKAARAGGAWDAVADSLAALGAGADTYDEAVETRRVRARR